MQFHVRQLIRRIEAGPGAIDRWRDAAIAAGCDKTATTSAAAVAKHLASWMKIVGGDVNRKA